MTTVDDMMKCLKAPFRHEMLAHTWEVFDSNDVPVLAVDGLIDGAEAMARLTAEALNEHFMLLGVYEPGKSSEGPAPAVNRPAPPPRGFTPPKPAPKPNDWPAYSLSCAHPRDRVAPHAGGSICQDCGSLFPNFVPSQR